MNQNTNVYYQARKAASLYNEKLFSREGASEMLGVSVSTLADYELGNTKVVPVDKVVLMSELYRCPELKNRYCKEECPIGRSLPIATEQKPIESVALRLLHELDTEGIEKMLKTVIKVAADGEIETDELDQIEDISRKMLGIQNAISEFQLMADKCRRER